MKENRACKDILAIKLMFGCKVSSCLSRKVANGPIGFSSWDGVGIILSGKTNHNKPRPQSCFFSVRRTQIIGLLVCSSSCALKCVCFSIQKSGFVFPGPSELYVHINILCGMNMNETPVLLLS